MKQKLLITGGSGFVAYHIIEAALKENYEVHVSIRSSSAVDHLKGFDIQYLTIDFSDKDAIIKILKEKQYNYIIHSAGTTRAKNQEEYSRVNATFTSNLAVAAMASGIPLKKFVFVSSLAAVGPSEDCVVDKFSPVTAYGESKLLAEKMLAEVKDLPLITFRPTAVYGPREKDIFIVFKTLSKGFEPYIGRQPQKMSFIYVKDLARLMVQSLTSGVAGKAYNISDGNVYDRYALAKITKEIIGKKTVRVHLPLPVVKLLAALMETAGMVNGKVPALNRSKINELTASWNCNIDEARKTFHFEPNYNLESGLKETISWYKEHKWL